MAWWWVIAMLGLLFGGRLAMSARDDDAGGGGAGQVGAWTYPPAAAPYVPAIVTAEQRNGIPPGLLGRLLEQESHFRPEVIRGDVVSSAGAVGIAQIVPRWHPDVNPRDPFQSIDYAGQYLASLYRRFGRWDLALAAYNWGQGNLSLALQSHGDRWIDAAPRETRNYVAQISRDIGGLA